MSDPQAALRVVVALLLPALAGCAERPWVSAQASPLEIEVAWHVVRGRPHVDAAGTCHYYADDNEDSLASVWRQVNACARGTVPLREPRDPGRGVKLVRMFLARDYTELNRWYIDSYGMASFKAFDLIASRSDLKPACVPKGGCSYFLAFYLGRDVMLVGSERRSRESLGHELKHVYDGTFHDGLGRRF